MNQLDYYCPSCLIWISRNDIRETMCSDYQEQNCKRCGHEVYHENDQRAPMPKVADEIYQKLVDAGWHPETLMDYHGDNPFKNRLIHQSDMPRWYGDWGAGIGLRQGKVEGEWIYEAWIWYHPQRVEFPHYFIKFPGFWMDWDESQWPTFEDFFSEIPSLVEITA